MPLAECRADQDCGAGGMASLGAMFGAGEVETFMGLPACRDLSELRAKVAILGAEGCTPYGTVGNYCAGGPAAIRAASATYAANLLHMNFDIGGPMLPKGVAAVDCGDVPIDPRDFEGNRARIIGWVQRIVDQGAVPVLLGGDDSIPIPMLMAFGGTRQKYTIVQIDAHIDWRDEVGGEKWGLSSTMRRASEMGHIERIIQLGQRGIGSARVSDVREAMAWGVHFVPAGEVARDGVWRAVDLIPEGSEVIICFDVDALDPSIMPAVIGRTAGGISYWHVLELIGAISEKARIAAVDMVEFMPERDVDGLGAMTAAQLLAGIIGIVARQP